MEHIEQAAEHRRHICHSKSAERKRWVRARFHTRIAEATHPHAVGCIAKRESREVPARRRHGLGLRVAQSALATGTDTHLIFGACASRARFALVQFLPSLLFLACVAVCS